MATLLQFPYLPGFPLHSARRIIVIDAGSHSIKILLVEKRGSAVRVLRRELVNVQEEKLLSPEEIEHFLQPILESMGDDPIALALPQHLPLSQILDLSAASEGVAQLIEAETFKNRDLRDSAIVYDCARLQPFGKHQNSFWVTLCKEADIFQQISRLSLHTEDICEIVPSANVLAVAFQRNNSAEHAVLVDIGASGTLATLLLNGQVVHAVTFPIGGNLFTETIASKKGCSVEAAETLKQTKNLFSGTDALPALVSVVDGWRNELERVVTDWLRENPEIKTPLASFRVVLSGGGATQTGLRDYLNRGSALQFAPWPQENENALPEQFVIAYGTALQTLGTTPRPASLLPAALRSTWNQQRLQQRFLRVAFFLLLITFFALAFGTWQKLSLIRQKRELLAQTAIALKKAETMETLENRFTEKYERLRPVLRRQQQTLDLLNTLALLERSRTNRNLWYVLFADQQSYFAGRTITSLKALPSHDAQKPKSGFIAELCLKQEGEAMRSTLGQVVGELKQSPLFSSVDTLPIDLRKDLANPKVLIPDRHFALSLELAEDKFQPSSRAKEIAVTNSPSESTSSSRLQERSNAAVMNHF
ncbi:MAG: Competence protein [Verrucomicrobiales bacterium]|nr:Competence protein [Verrucomicrobiales bacterium]